MKMVLDVVRPEMGKEFGSKEVEPRLMRGLSMDRNCPCVLLA